MTAVAFAARADCFATIVASCLTRALIVAEEALAAATVLHDATQAVFNFMQPALRAEVALLAPSALEE